MFGNLDFEKLLVLAAVGLIVLGPERLPKIAADAARVLRAVRRFTQSATSELREELGPQFADLDLAELHPRRFIQRHLFEDDEPAPAKAPAADVPAAAPAPAAAHSFAGPPPFDREAT